MLGILPWMIMTAIVFPRLWFAAQDLRMIEVSPLGRDEGWYGGTLWGGWQTGAPIFFSTYGFLYNNIFWIIAKLFSFILSITEQTTIILSRGINLAAYLSLGIIPLYWLIRKRGFLFALLYSLLLFLFSKDNDLIIRATSIQADLLNFMTILLSFFIILQLANKFTVKTLVTASFMAGVVMAVKFFGFMLMPFILFTLILIKLNRQERTNLVANIKKIFERLTLVIICILTLIILFEVILPTRSIYGDIIKIPQLFFPQFFIGLLLLLRMTLGILSLLKSTSKFNFLLSATTLSILVFILSFTLFSSKSLFRINFLNFLVPQIYQQQYFYSALNDKLNIIFNEGLGILLSTIFIFSSVYFILKLLFDKTTLDKEYIISLIWSWFMIFFFLLLTRGFAIRYLYILYPAIVFVAVYSIVNLYKFLPRAKLIMPVFIGLIFLRSLQIIQTQVNINRTQFSCLECIPGIQVGRWLDKNFPDSQTKIMQEISVYVPQRFQDPRFFSWGDPYPYFSANNPDVIFLTGSHVRNVFGLKDNSIDFMYRVEAMKPKKFLLDLYIHKLPYRQVALFGSIQDDNDIIVFIKD